jgi:hypothetical protein
VGIVADPKIDAYIGMVAGWVIRQAARPGVADALARIERAARIQHQQSLRVLALRRYLRLQDRDHVDLSSIWTWSNDQAQASLRDGSGRDLMNEAARVQAAFARNNPGYTLGVSPPRSLARQVRLWVEVGRRRNWNAPSWSSQDALRTVALEPRLSCAFSNHLLPKPSRGVRL